MCVLHFFQVGYLLEVRGGSCGLLHGLDWLWVGLYDDWLLNWLGLLLFWAVCFIKLRLQHSGEHRVRRGVPAGLLWLLGLQGRWATFFIQALIDLERIKRKVGLVFLRDEHVWIRWLVGGLEFLVALDFFDECASSFFVVVLLKGWSFILISGLAACLDFNRLVKLLLVDELVNLGHHLLRSLEQLVLLSKLDALLLFLLGFGFFLVELDLDDLGLLGGSLGVLDGQIQEDLVAESVVVTVSKSVACEVLSWLLRGREVDKDGHLSAGGNGQICNPGIALDLISVCSEEEDFLRPGCLSSILEGPGKSELGSDFLNDLTWWLADALGLQNGVDAFLDDGCLCLDGRAHHLHDLLPHSWVWPCLVTWCIWIVADDRVWGVLGLSDLDHWMRSVHGLLAFFAEIVVWPHGALVPDPHDRVGVAAIARIALMDSSWPLSLALTHLAHLALEEAFLSDLLHFI